jgi:hypothetical protein
MGRKKAKTAEYRGIWKPKKHKDDPDLRVVDTSYSSDKLADLVASAWLDEGLRNRLITGTVKNRAKEAKQELVNRQYFLANPIVITEEEYDEGWQMDGDDEVVLVLPDVSLAVLSTGTGPTPTPLPKNQLLETAKLLMALTPHGI